ncbi:hypothetical protein M5K25_022825 [Dendrobium thyrsiflorum]|uniref:Wax synthase domain-containing protein n=1 Tax=Dendrobium thyrsiflorum TaxID=117978 RepID=A0ABD0UDB0_DENTH
MPLAVDRSFPWMQEVVIMLLLREYLFDSMKDKYLNNLQRTALDTRSWSQIWSNRMFLRASFIPLEIMPQQQFLRAKWCLLSRRNLLKLHFSWQTLGFAKASYLIGCCVSFICYGDSIVRRLYWRILLAGIIHEAILFYFPPTRKEERKTVRSQPDGVLKPIHAKTFFSTEKKGSI